MKKMKEKAVVPPKGINIVFSNIEQLLPVNQEFLNAMLKRRSDSGGVVQKIGDIFTHMVRLKLC